MPAINSIDLVEDLSPNEEKIEVTKDAIAVKMTDVEFSNAVNEQIKRAKADEDKIKLTQRRDINRKYWKGDQLDLSALRTDEEKSVENVIFRNIETFIPIATASTPELSVTPTYKNDATRAFAGDVKRVLMTRWEIDDEMQMKVGRGIRNHQIELIGVFQLGYDPEDEEFWTEEVVATDLVISKKGDFVARYIKDQTLEDLVNRFPDKKSAVLEEFGANDAGYEQMKSSPVEYVEAWTDEVVGWKLNQLVLGVENNPHFDYDGEDVVVGSDEYGSPVNKKCKYNYFKHPKKPFLFLVYWNRGIYVWDDTTLIEQSIGLQDWINKRKRQIGLNADSTNGHWVSSGDYISKEEFDKIEGTINEKIWLEAGIPADGLQKITGQPLPDYIYTDLVDSRAAADNLMGIHSTTRGEESKNPTLGQDVLQKQGDSGRVDGYVRDGVEVFAKHYYEYMYHLHLVYITKETALAIPEDDDFEQDNVIFSRDKVPKLYKKNGELCLVPLKFKVKKGSTLPSDDVAEAIKADKMKDIMSPIDYFKKAGEPNPRELAKNFLLWQNDPFSFFQEDEDVMAMMQRLAGAKQEEQDTEIAGKEADSQMKIKEKIAGEKAKQTEPTVKGLSNAVRSIVESEEGAEEGNGASPEGVGNAMRAMMESGEV